jgi:hypothetical protein
MRFFLVILNKSKTLLGEVFEVRAKKLILCCQNCEISKNLKPMLFRTPIPLFPAPFKINHEEQILFMGSCFTENIGTRMLTLKFPTFINPFGILFNPMSISKGLELVLDNYQFKEEDLFFDQGLWHSFFFHGRFSKSSKEDTLSGMNQALQTMQKSMADVSCIFITLGTAYVYIDKETSEIVANCHKRPSRDFARKMLSPDEIVAEYFQLLAKVRKAIPNVKVIFTISPVRHIRDGFVENQVSKSALILAAAKICEELDYAHYFPAYELMMDDLRDYRFYEKDMIHPNGQAIDYIWDYFVGLYFEEGTNKLIKEIGRIQDAVQHKPFLPHSAEYQNFISRTLGLIDNCELNNKGIRFEKELEILNRSISH